jgi:hypothetical protein
MAADLESTLVLRSENVRSIGLKDRWWQACSAAGAAWPQLYSTVCTDRVLYESDESQSRISFGSQ